MSKKKVYRGGVIPYFHDADGQLLMLFMKPSQKKYGGVQFQIAKGKREDGEDDETAAFREAREELGLFKPNCAEITHLGEFLGRTAIYHCRVEDPTNNMFGKPCDETAETRWMTPEEFEAEGRTLHKPIVKAAVRSIQRMCESVQKYSNPILLEIFDKHDVDVEVKRVGDTISGYFNINNKEFVCDIEISTHDVASNIKLANVAFARIVNGERLYNIQNDPTVNLFELGAVCLHIIYDNLPTDVKAIVLIAAHKNGAIGKQSKVYNHIAKRLAKWERMGTLSNQLTTPTGTLNIIYNSEILDSPEGEKLRQFVEQNTTK